MSRTPNVAANCCVSLALIPMARGWHVSNGERAALAGTPLTHEGKNAGSAGAGNGGGRQSCGGLDHRTGPHPRVALSIAAQLAHIENPKSRSLYMSDKKSSGVKQIPEGWTNAGTNGTTPPAPTPPQPQDKKR